MLDKSVPFYTIIMKRHYKEAPAPIVLPEGYRIRAYTPGDEIGWAEIQTSVLEFGSMEEALDCHKGYLSRIEDLKKRQWFVENPEGVLVATATAWSDETPKGKIPVVHALSCRPKDQGKGLGRAIAIQMLEIFYNQDRNLDVWLDTQTWSYKAVELYLSLGFVPMKKEIFNKTANEYDKALIVFEKHMRKEAYQKFLKSAV